MPRRASAPGALACGLVEGPDMADETESPPQVTLAGAGPSLVHIASRVIGRPLLLHPQKAEVIMHVLEGRLPISGGLAPLSPDANRFIGSWKRPSGKYGLAPAQGGVAIITIAGSLVNRGAFIGTNSGLVSYEGISAQLRDVRDDPEVKAVILDLDSPGGEATGMFAVAQLVKEVAAIKPVIAVVNDMAASAAYGIASAATEIVVSPTSMVGSIGVVLTHVDRSGEMANKGIKTTFIYAGAHKVDGHPFGPLSEAVKADLQAEVAKFYDTFVGLVADGRGAKLTADMARQTEARVFLGQEAVDRGLADRVASLDAVLAEYSSASSAKSAKTSKGNPSMSGNTGAAPQAENAGITQAAHDAAVAAARIEGANAERGRIKGILTHAEAEGRTAQATAIALETDMTAEQAGKVLAASPKADGAQKPKSIEERAKEQGSAGMGNGDLPKAGAEVDKAWGAAVGNINKTKGL